MQVLDLYMQRVRRVQVRKPRKEDCHCKLLYEKAKTWDENSCLQKVATWKLQVENTTNIQPILLMEEILHQLSWQFIYRYLTGVLAPSKWWFFGISSINQYQPMLLIMASTGHTFWPRNADGRSSEGLELHKIWNDGRIPS